MYQFNILRAFSVSWIFVDTYQFENVSCVVLDLGYNYT